MNDTFGAIVAVTSVRYHHDFNGKMTSVTLNVCGTQCNAHEAAFKREIERCADGQPSLFIVDPRPSEKAKT